MATIWKFELTIDDFVSVEMPEGAVVISVGNQNGTLCLWAMCHTSMPMEVYKFAIVPFVWYDNLT